MNVIGKYRKGMHRWKPTIKRSHVNTAAKNPRASFSATRKTGNSVRRSAGGNSQKKGKPRSKQERAVPRTPFPGRLDERSYITKSGRVRLYGEDMLGLRMDVFLRSKGFCEAKLHHPACPRYVGWNFGELAHKKHGPFKTDTPEGTEFRSSVCHQIMQHSGFKPQGVK